MSKSLGNGIDPLEKIDEFGADALRFMLSTGITPGNDMRFKDDKLEAARNFANKLWNASRFVIMNIKDDEGNFLPMAELDKAELKDEEKWILDKLAEATSYVNNAFDRFDLALAGQRVYELIWSEYCDWYIELVKRRLWADDEGDKMLVRATLVKAMKDMLKLLHPFMPFITEEIWGYLPHTEEECNSEGKSMLISAAWPGYDKPKYSEATARVELAMEAIKAIRNMRSEVDAAPSRKLTAVMVAEGESLDNIRSCERYIKELANITDIKFVTSKADAPSDAMSAIITGVEILIPMADLIDYSVEAERLQKEVKRLEGEVKRASSKLSNEGFVSKAPAALIDAEKAKLVDYEQQLAKVKSNLETVMGKLK